MRQVPTCGVNGGSPSRANTWSPHGKTGCPACPTPAPIVQTGTRGAEQGNVVTQHSLTHSFPHHEDEADASSHIELPARPLLLPGVTASPPCMAVPAVPCAQLQGGRLALRRARCVLLCHPQVGPAGTGDIGAPGWGMWWREEGTCSPLFAFSPAPTCPLPQLLSLNRWL